MTPEREAGVGTIGDDAGPAGGSDDEGGPLHPLHGVHVALGTGPRSGLGTESEPLRQWTVGIRRTQWGPEGHHSSSTPRPQLVRV